ncbi:MAG TPA: twin-arginine translocase TatA/TatE family subunit [Bacteroidales bacterium]|nr:twin-arginine translocase TatA/TatE family subunit [Bacteroidales bacterium]HPK29664.1 twin-arginine translocase TatA/TatE family subunit [Bacteroidales bacterium]
MRNLLLFGSFGWQEILIIAFIVLLFWGGKKIPELMKGLGKGVRSFKEGMKEVENEVKGIDDEPKNGDKEKK